MTTTKETRTCGCCGGLLPARDTWEANREIAAECTGSVDAATGRCSAYAADETWEDVYCVQTDGFLCDDFRAASLDEAIEYAFSGEGLGKITDLESLERKFAKYVADGGWCTIDRNGECVVEIGESN